MTFNDCWYKGKCLQNCGDNCIRYKLVKSLFSQSNLPENLWKPKDLLCEEKGDKSAFDELNLISKDIENHIKSGYNIYIYSGNPGNGKTSWAIKLMYAYFDKIWHKSCFECKALFINVPKFLYTCKKSISENIEGFDNLCKLIPTVDLVVWDDVGETVMTGYEHQIIFQYIDDRLNMGKANIYTSNKDYNELSKLIGDRLASRIYNGSQCIHFVEADKRGLLNW